jgi:hypothetical protein
MGAAVRFGHPVVDPLGARPGDFLGDKILRLYPRQCHEPTSRTMINA